ncbi:MAG: hypothetical protein KDK36_04460 [Leptospiraceae bacterium]|nr:hypothetical protein [Leptospiraceae bacterium]
MERIIQQPYVYTQSYINDPDNSIHEFSETASICKIDISGLELLTIGNIKNFVGNTWKKTSTSLQPKIAFILSDDLEFLFYEPTYLKIIPQDGVLITPLSIDELEIIAQDTKENVKRFCYYTVPLVTVDDFSNLNIYNQISSDYFYSFPIVKEVSNVFDGEFVIPNQFNKKYLYIIPYCQSLLQTEIYYQGNLQFSIWGE